MLGRLWPRFALEAIFLVAVAVTAGLLDLTVAQIVAVMAGAYLLTVAVELGAWRLRRSRPPATPVLAGTTMQVLEPEPEAVAEEEPEPEPLVEEEPEEELEPVAEEEPEPEPVAEEEPEPVAEEPEVEPEPEEEPEPVAEEEPEPEPEAEPEPVRLVAVPAPAPPAPEPEPELEREPEPEPAPAAVATLPLPPEPQAWNLWELERLAREAGASDPDREQELGYLVVYLREFASPDGLLPAEFDELVRDSFGQLLAGGRR